MDKFTFHRTVIGLSSLVLITLAAFFIIPSARPALCSQGDPQCEVLRERISKPRNSAERNRRDYYCQQMKDRNCSEYEKLCGEEAKAGPAPNLIGSWTCTGDCPAKCPDKKDASIDMTDQGLTFTNECGGKSLGQFENNNTSIRATEWKITAKIENGGKQLNWGNGSIWNKK